MIVVRHGLMATHVAQFLIDLPRMLGKRHILWLNANYSSGCLQLMVGPSYLRKSMKLDTNDKEYAKHTAWRPEDIDSNIISWITVPSRNQLDKGGGITKALRALNFL